MNKVTSVFYWLFFIVLIGYAVVAVFIFPFGDDFTYALKGQSADFINVVLNERDIWNGRYLSNFFVIASPLNYGGLLAYRFVPVLLLLTCFFTILFVFRGIALRSRVLISGGLLVGILSALPSITESFYWYTGAITYTPPAVFLIYLFSSYLKRTPKRSVQIIQFIGIVLCSGFNEIFVIVNIFFLLFFFAKFQFNRWLGLLLIMQIGLFFYVLSAPGNSVRGDNFSNNHQFFDAVFQAGLYTVRFILEWVLNPIPVLLALVSVRLNLRFFQLNCSWWQWGLLLLVPVYLSCFGPIWSTGILGQYRTANFSLFSFYFIWFLFLNQKLALFKEFHYQKTAGIVLCSGMLFWGNNFFLWKELFSGELAALSQTLAKRVDLLQNCKSSICFVPAVKSELVIYDVYKLTNSSEDWKNKGYQLYYESGAVLPKD